MILYIIGNSNDNKGAQLEKLISALLKKAGNEYIRRDIIDAVGSESR